MFMTKSPADGMLSLGIVEIVMPDVAITGLSTFR
jgi:hypothetical protein